MTVMKTIDMNKQTTTIWQFPRISPVKQREGFYCKESMCHPAKMPTYLVQAIILTYTKEGDLILDPMSGIGTTVIEAIKLKRDAIGIEYEKKFADICIKNLNLTKQKLANNLGRGIFLRGDSRELSGLIARKNVGSIIFSPPFADTLAGSSKDDLQKFKHGSAGKDYGDKDDPIQIGNLKHSRIDTVIFSPPYSEGLGHRQGQAGKYQTAEERKKYAWRIELSNQFKEQMSAKNISNLPHGNLNVSINGIQTYTSEMLKVYQECFRVLKNKGYMVLIVKNFRRKGEEINLMGETIQLCKMAGFKFFQTCIHVLNGASFWQINNTRKTPGLMLNMAEYVLVFQKG